MLIYLAPSFAKEVYTGRRGFGVPFEDAALRTKDLRGRGERFAEYESSCFKLLTEKVP